MRGVIATLRERGQLSAAAHEERLLAQKLAGGRADLALTHAAEVLLRSVASDPSARQLRTFERVLQQFGPDAGLLALDRLVRPFVEHLRSSGRHEDAQRALALTRGILAIPPGTQFDRELTRLESRSANGADN